MQSREGGVLVLIANKCITWAFEIMLQAFLVGILLTVLLNNGRPVTGMDLLLMGICVLYIFTVSGYSVITLLTRIFWSGHKLWSYSVLAAALFLIHFEVVNRLVFRNGVGPLELRPTSRVGGACTAFLCTFLGSLSLTNLTAARDKAAHS